MTVDLLDSLSQRWDRGSERKEPCVIHFWIMTFSRVISLREKEVEEGVLGSPPFKKTSGRGTQSVVHRRAEVLEPLGLGRCLWRMPLSKLPTTT